MKTKTRQYEGWRRTTPLSRTQDLFFALFGRTPKQLADMLDADAREQAERFVRMEQAILLPLRAPEPVLVPALDDGPYMGPEDVPQEYTEPMRPRTIDVAPVRVTPVIVQDAVKPLRAEVTSPVQVQEAQQAQPALVSRQSRDFRSAMPSSRVRRRVI